MVEKLCLKFSQLDHGRLGDDTLRTGRLVLGHKYDDAAPTWEHLRLPILRQNGRVACWRPDE